MFIVNENTAEQDEDQDDANIQAKMTSRVDMQQFFSNEQGLEYFDLYVFPNNSCYRG